MAKEWDVFISHASEDKRDAALPIAESLRKERLKVWIDERELSVGDSLRERINEGLARSRYGVVILSPSFLDKPWPKDELNAMLAREEGGAKVVIPVRYKISQQEVARDYPLIADRVSLALEDGLDCVVGQIMAIIGRPENAVAVDIAIDFSHKQREWSSLDQSMKRHSQRFTRVEKGILEQPELIEACRALVVPPPMHTRFAKSEIDWLENWVNVGGGLFLMGYYDERHHSSNFSELAWRFDFDFRHNLLLPDSTKSVEQLRQDARSQVWSQDPEYAVLLEIDPQTTPHPIVDGVSEIAFVSASSIVSTSMKSPELLLQSPATTWIMRPIGHIQPDGSRPAIETWEPDRQGSVPLLAARKWKKGRVVVSGTWKLWTGDYDNRKILDNILNWLVGA